MIGLLQWYITEEYTTFTSQTETGYLWN